MQRKLIEELRGGDRRSIGRSDEIARRAAADRALFGKLVEALWHEDAIVRMRAADAIEKASAGNHGLLNPYKAELMGLLGEATQQELRWHLAAMVARLELTRGEMRRAATTLREYMGDKSSIVRTFAMQALADLAERDESMKSDVLELIRRAVKTGSPAMRARGRKLLKRMERS